MFVPPLSVGCVWNEHNLTGVDILCRAAVNLLRLRQKGCRRASG
jgi:hypothetical protein